MHKLHSKMAFFILLLVLDYNCEDKPRRVSGWTTEECTIEANTIVCYVCCCF